MLLSPDIRDHWLELTWWHQWWQIVSQLSFVVTLFLVREDFLGKNFFLSGRVWISPPPPQIRQLLHFRSDVEIKKCTSWKGTKNLGSRPPPPAPQSRQWPKKIFSSGSLPLYAILNLDLDYAFSIDKIPHFVLIRLVLVVIAAHHVDVVIPLIGHRAEPCVKERKKN